VYFYVAREILPALALFTVAFALLGLLALGLFAVCKAGEQIVRVLERNSIRKQRRWRVASESVARRSET
jgi:hypothetical protein